MRRAQTGDTVNVHYTGTLADGSVFDSSRGREPLQFTVGSGGVIPGFDAAVAGMTVGEEKKVTIPADQAYGPHRADLMVEVDRARLPEDLEPAVGQQLQLSRGGQVFVVTVRDVSDGSVLLDGNHPLAGEDLTFALELVGVQ